MSFGTQILDKSDLNSYKEPGNYYCSGSLAAQQLINSPTKNAFVMKVELGTGINYPTQTITSFGDGKKYFRVYIPENTEWRNWVEYVTNTDLQAKRYDVPQPTPGSIFSSFGVWGCRVLKSGKVVTIQINVDGSMVANYNFNVLFTLPVEYRPMVDVISNYVTQKGTPMLLNILKTGEFVLNNLNVAINDSWICRQQIVYITDK